MKLTVQEFIDKLQKIDDKKQIVKIHWKGSPCDCTDIVYIGMSKMKGYESDAMIIYR